MWMVSAHRPHTTGPPGRAILVAASLEAFAGFCLGCWLFRILMTIGVVPEETCEACRDLWGIR